MGGAVGESVRRLRRERKWSAQRLADECALVGATNLTRGTLAKIESGVRKNVTTDELVALAKALGVQPGALLTDGGDTPPALPPPTAGKRPYQGAPPSLSKRTARTLADDLARLNQASLDRPLLPAETSDVVVPTIADGYVAPAVRVVQSDPRSALHDEMWWASQEVHTDSELVIMRHLASAAAVNAPVLILGQPGSGKSLLTSVLAARLPADSFVAIRVQLRDVPGNVGLPEQVEYALRRQLAEQVSWASFVRTIDNEMPVLLFDGLDDLLSSGETSGLTYMQQIAEFQRISHDVGRPVAVIVTGRTALVNRVRVPNGTLVVRLEQFDDAQIAGWLDTWNATNASVFATKNLQPLAATTIADYAELARQPILLVALALIHAENKLVAGLTKAQLYQALLESFAAREIQKSEFGHTPNLADKIEEYLRQLAIIALGMLNRGSRSISSRDLDFDLSAILGTDLTRRQSSAQNELVSRFFFLHTVRDSADEPRVRTHEFLNDTFAEYLVARFIFALINDLVEYGRSRFSQLVDDGLLYSVLSFAVLSRSPAIVDLLAGMAAQLSAAERAERTNLLLQLFRASGAARHRDDRFGYEPRRLSLQARYANYRANLVVLIIPMADDFHASDLFESEGDLDRAWQRELLYWQSQLDDMDWENLCEILSGIG
ncbi:helix-turn-helix domain-containing protein [Amycolatopsis sp. NPDC004772]